MKIRRRVLVCVFLMGAQAIVGVGAVTNYWTGASSTNWHDAANWSEGVVPATGDDVVLSDSGLRPFLDQATPRMNSLMLDEGQTLTQLGWDSTLDAVNLRIDGTITHGVNPGETNRLGQWEPWHRILLAGSNITINGMLDANGRGFGRNAGPGRPTHSYGGGGYGTSGGWGFGGGYYSGGSEYGEPSAPWWPGSGGGPINTSRSGGGAIRVMADGHLEINGTLSANGVNGVVSHGGGGSGGGIWLHCRTFGGHETGRIRACGGNGQSCGGSGGGGRIAVHYDAQAQEEEPIPAVRFEAFAGKQGTDDRLPPKRQAMGSLFLTDNQWLQGDFTGGRFDHTKLVIPGMTTWTYAGDLCLDDCRIELDRGVSLAVTGSLVLTNGAALALQAAPVEIPIETPGVTLQTRDDLEIHAGSWVYPVADPTNGAMAILSVGGDLHIRPEGGVDANAAGYAPGEGPGRAQTIDSGDGGHGGGGYGGQGGSGYNGAGPGASYGAVNGPVQCGSGGGGGLNYGSGAGGGAIRLKVAGDAMIDGWLKASGSQSHYGHRGGGAGGGISVSCRTLRGGSTGRIVVEGGQAHYYGGCGAGGRIVIDYDSVLQAAEVHDRPELKFSGYVFPKSRMGDTFTLPPEMGTLWLPDFQLLADGPTATCRMSDSRFRHTRLFVSGYEHTWSPAALTLDNCVLGLPDGFDLQVAETLLLTNGAAIHMRASATNGSDRLYGATVTIGQDLLVSSNSWIYPWAAPTNGAVVGIQVGASVHVAVGGGIDATGGGFYPASNNGIGPGAGTHYSCGGGYGGHGGGTLGGNTYGMPALPVLPGSPGGWYHTNGRFTNAGRGGGVILLLAEGILHLDGALIADGQTGSLYKGASGSGGSIFLAARRFKGRGQLLARGKPWGTTFSTYSSGGGRIAVWRGVERSQVEACLRGATLPSLAVVASVPAFEGGTIDVHSIGTEEPQYAGTAGFYSLAGTFFMLR